jgi:hypothetical protein
MDRTFYRDQQLEGTANPTGNAEKSGPPPWELERYIYQESSTDDGRSSHSDPRLELALRQHQESAFIPSDDDDSEYGYPAFGSDFTSHLDASGSSANDLGTLAGGGLLSKCKNHTEGGLYQLENPSLFARVSNPPRKDKAYRKKQGEARYEVYKERKLERRLKPLRPN